jgi:hypothetical protein
MALSLVALLVLLAAAVAAPAEAFASPDASHGTCSVNALMPILASDFSRIYGQGETSCSTVSSRTLTAYLWHKPKVGGLWTLQAIASTQGSSTFMWVRASQWSICSIGVNWWQTSATLSTSDGNKSAWSPIRETTAAPC